MLQTIEQAGNDARISMSCSSSNSGGSFSNSEDGSSHSDESSRTSDPRTDFERHIDEVFGSAATKLGPYEPPAVDSNTSELLNSRIVVRVRTTLLHCTQTDALFAVAFRSAHRHRGSGLIPSRSFGSLA